MSRKSWALATNNSKKYLKLIEDNNLIENIVEPFYKTEKFDFLYKIYYNINIKIIKKGKL